MRGKLITGVIKGGIGEEVGIEAGDRLISINSKGVEDVFDYRFLLADDYAEVLVEKENGEEWILEIEKDEDEDLGLIFEQPMMDDASSCKNRCIFCFIDQLPKGMRDTLYFKDDDSRLSFLQGNYVTLTNMSDKNLDRIISYKMSPINVSVHSTDGKLRAKILQNKNAGRIMEQLRRISAANISINCQIVLVKGVNTGDALRDTLEELSKIKGVESVSVVPAGLTRYREGLAPLMPFESPDALEAIGITEGIAGRMLGERGIRFAYASDELYIKAGIDLPAYEHYDGFPQLENGVGMVRLFEREFYDALYGSPRDELRRVQPVTVVTGLSAYGFIKSLMDELSLVAGGKISVLPVKNNFFGDSVTVSGLLTGEDIIKALIDSKTKGRVLLPGNCFKADCDVLLDDVTMGEISARAGVEAVKVCVDGGTLAACL